MKKNPIHFYWGRKNGLIVTREEADDLYKNKLDEFIAWAQIKGQETTGLEGLFMRPLSYQGYERRRYDNGKWEENGEAKDRYKKYRDRFVSGRTGESIREDGRDAAVSEEGSLQKVAEQAATYSNGNPVSTKITNPSTIARLETGKKIKNLEYRIRALKPQIAKLGNEMRNEEIKSLR